jgi:hypothetical protein
MQVDFKLLADEKKPAEAGFELGDSLFGNLDGLAVISSFAV